MAHFCVADKSGFECRICGKKFKVVYVVVGSGKYREDGKDYRFSNKKKAEKFVADIRFAGGEVSIVKAVA